MASTERTPSTMRETPFTEAVAEFAQAFREAGQTVVERSVAA